MLTDAIIEALGNNCGRSFAFAIVQGNDHINLAASDSAEMDKVFHYLEFSLS
jgi:hypothetical protein